MNYLEIESTSGLDQTVKQSLKFKTGNFVWRVRFSTALDPATVNGNNISVSSSTGFLRTSFDYDAYKNELEITPLEPYAQDEVYTLSISTRVLSRGGKPLKAPLEVKFRL